MATITTRAVYNGKVRDVLVNTDQITHVWVESLIPPHDIEGEFAEVHLANGTKLTVQLSGPGSTHGGKAAALIELQG